MTSSAFVGNLLTTWGMLRQLKAKGWVYFIPFNKCNNNQTEVHSIGRLILLQYGIYTQNQVLLCISWLLLNK